MKKTIVLITTMAVMVGCSQRQVSREEWLAMTTHTFPKTTVDAVLKTGDQVLTLSDPSDVSVSHSRDKLVAYRKFLIYAVFSATIGRYEFDLAAEQKGDDVVATLDMKSSITPVFGGEIKHPWKWREAYDLFYGRMEALLYGATWKTCTDAQEKSEASWYLEPLCLLADDNLPESGVKLTETVQKKQAAKTLEKSYTDKL